MQWAVLERWRARGSSAEGLLTSWGGLFVRGIYCEVMVLLFANLRILHRVRGLLEGVWFDHRAQEE